MKNTLYFFGIIIITSFASCYYDNFQELNPGAGLIDNCDTTGTISFSQHVLPILTTNCAVNNSACHATNATGFYSLGNYAGVQTAINNNKLISSIIHDGSASNMPKNGNKIDDCSITTIQKWVTAGHPNN